jgi:glutamate-5-semialdehyde dehydrogenase
MALEIASDAKIQYPSACNAMETLLVHKDVAASFFPKYAGRELYLIFFNGDGGMLV